MHRTMLMALMLVLGSASLALGEDTPDTPFFENNVSRAVTWERPANMPLFAEDGRPYWIVDGHASWSPADPADGWLPRWSDDGQPYFESLSSGEVSRRALPSWHTHAHPVV